MCGQSLLLRESFDCGACNISHLLQESPEFDLHFDKVYKWVASSTVEKNTFISCIWKLNQKYLRKKIGFINVSSQLLEGKFLQLYLKYKV